jgi:cellulose synthase/poly-beta-1,6-N-acetylglucosamine synthase-like glycosyltransferase
LRCLAAVAGQTRSADELIVVVRDDDGDTWQALEKLEAPAFRTVSVAQPGLVYAMNAGLATVQTDIVAITDDDAAPHADWLERIVATFETSPQIGAVGGRDFLYVNGVLQDGSASVVGRVPKLGKHVGNHHLGFGPARDVDALKGVNGAYRVEALRPIGFDRRLRGTGAQVYWELSLGIALRRAGWRLVYDPQILVDHFTAPRFDEDQRHGFNPVAMSNLAYNEAIVRLEHLSLAERFAYVVWAVAIGTRAVPGLLQRFRFARTEGAIAGKKYVAALAGLRDAVRDTFAARRPAP